MLYDRDYRILTEQEMLEWEKVEEEYKKASPKGIISTKSIIKYYSDIPLAALHYKQLFPNNFLNTENLRKREELRIIIEDFNQLLQNKITERDILSFIKERKAYFIIGSILKSQHYLFGHHGAFAFKEFELPPNFIADFLLVGKNSGGYEFIFIELENAYGQITTNDGDFGVTIRKGIKQVNDWDHWLEANYSCLKLVFDKSLGKTHDLPRDFFELDKSRLHYVVIAGKREDFNDKTYLSKRKLLKSNNILILHYDNLVDSANYLLSHGYY